MPLPIPPAFPEELVIFLGNRLTFKTVDTRSAIAVKLAYITEKLNRSITKSLSETDIFTAY